jgi:hypothetical protein
MGCSPITYKLALIKSNTQLQFAMEHPNQNISQSVILSVSKIYNFSLCQNLKSIYMGSMHGSKPNAKTTQYQHTLNQFM